MVTKTSPKPQAKTRPVSAGYLRAFDAVARHLNFRQAAEELATSQPAVSRQIQSLEDELGLSLFTRHTRSVELTQAGSKLAQEVNLVLHRIDAAVAHVRLQQGRQSVAITSFASFASMWVIPQLEQFQIAQPEIDFRIDATDRYVDLQRSDQDIALRAGYTKDMPTDAILLFHERLVPMASPRLLPAGGLSSVEDLSQHSLIEVLREDNPYMSWQAWLEHHGYAHVEPKRWMRINYTYQILQVALAGQGLILARLPMTTESVARGDLVEVFPGRTELQVNPPLAYWMLVNRASTQRPEVKALVQWLSDAARLTREFIG